MREFSGARISKRQNTIRSMSWLSWLITFFMLVPLTLWISVNYSRDYLGYIEVIANLDATDLLFDAYIKTGKFLEASPEAIYYIYAATQIGLLILFFARRQVSGYWIFIYLLSFGTLHVVTQVRAGMASVLLALLLTSTQFWVRLLTPLSIGIHSSSILFIGAGISRRSPTVIAATMLGSAIAALYFAVSNSEKLSLYLLEINESQPISIALVVYIVALAAIPFAHIDRKYKAILLIAGVLTIVVYFQFIDFKAISNRFVELSNAVTILIFGALDKSYENRKAAFSPWLKFILAANAFTLFYVSNVVNSILNI